VIRVDIYRDLIETPDFPAGLSNIERLGIRTLFPSEADLQIVHPIYGNDFFMLKATDDNAWVNVDAGGKINDSLFCLEGRQLASPLRRD